MPEAARPLASGEQVVLVRHGQTDDNREPVRVQGFTDTPLNDTGRAQARAAAERIADGPPPACIWTSDLVRARETAEIIAAKVGLTPRPDPRLREANRGRWEGQLFVEIAREEPQRFAAWRQAGAEFRFPGGESLLEQQVRVHAAVQELRATAPLPALAVCHGGAIRVMLCLADPRGLDAFHDFSVPNLAMVAV
ncbi:MAG TPA: histidine phosphatase family protein [Solirubrobacteraceae bacterium]|nr:histidine phosphatase family protein [Solirubrobacteraceae bacterium]